MSPMIENSQDALRSTIEQLISGQIWSPCLALDRNLRKVFNGKHARDALPQLGGLYSVHIRGIPIRAYIGQSRDLRRRIQELQGVFSSEMPFKDPHVAGPGLWAWRHIEPIRTLEVSIAVIDCSAYLRQGLEDLVIAHERWKHAYDSTSEERWRGQYSPLLNFGRMPPGYRPSTFRAKAYRGGPTRFEHESHEPGIAPVTNLLEEKRHPLDERWGGHDWSPWCYARDFIAADGDQGLYRISKQNSQELLFIGRGRLTAAAKDAARSTPLLRFSAVAGSWKPHQQLELLSDSLGLYLLTTNTLPRAQYRRGDSTYPTTGPLPFPSTYLTCTAWLVSILSRSRGMAAPPAPLRAG